MTPILLRSEFLSMTDSRLAEWELVLVDEVNNGPLDTVRLSELELDVLRHVMAERGIR